MLPPNHINMARLIHWQIPFASLNGDNFTINIYEEDYTGSIVTLKGGTEPFITDEENDNDIMLPMRTSTGNITIIAEDHLDIFATGTQSNYVTLTKGSQCVWQGYLQPISNDINWAPFPQKVEFPVVSCFGSLYDIEMPEDSFPLVSLRNLIHDAIIASGGSYTNIVFPGEWTTDSGAKDFGMLNAQISRFAFFAKIDMANDSPEFKRYDADSYGLMLEKIMKYLGWSLYEQGDTIVMTTPNCRTYKTTTIDGLKHDSPVILDIAATTIQLPASRSHRNTQSIVPPNRSITLSTNAQATTDNLIELTTEGDGIMLGEEVDTTGYKYDVKDMNIMGGRRAVGFSTHINSDVFEIIPHEYRISYSREFDDEPLELDYIDDISDPLPPYDFFSAKDSHIDEKPSVRSFETHFGAQIFRWDLDTASSFNSKINLSYKDCIAIVMSYAEDPNKFSPISGLPVHVGLTEEQLKAHPVVTLRSKVPISLRNGLICIELNSSIPSMYYARVKCGNQYAKKYGDYYYGWVDDENWFIIRTGQNDKTSWSRYQKYNEAKGVIIETYGTISGELVIDLAPVTPSDTMFFGFIDSLSVKLMLPDLYGGKERDSENLYYGTMANNGEARELSLDILTMNNNEVCNNCLWFMNDYLTDQIRYNGKESRPEIVLVEKIKQAYGSIREVIDVTTEVSTTSPINSFSYNGKNYEILSRSFNYRDATVDFKLIEKI